MHGRREYVVLSPYLLQILRIRLIHANVRTNVCVWGGESQINNASYIPTCFDFCAPTLMPYCKLECSKVYDFLYLRVLFPYPSQEMHAFTALHAYHYYIHSMQAAQR